MGKFFALSFVSQCLVATATLGETESDRKRNKERETESDRKRKRAREKERGRKKVGGGEEKEKGEVSREE